MGSNTLLITLRGKTTRVELADGSSVTVGRAGECDICLDDSRASRRHAVFYGARTVEVEDLGSHNGTLVLAHEQLGAAGNEAPERRWRTRIAANVRVVVVPDATIQIGDALITLEAAPPPTADAPAGTILLDPQMIRLYELASRVAESELGVLLLGETGVGKEVLARFVHQRSSRAGRALVSLNCGATPEALLEAELFGYEKGAFAGAVKTTKGLLETASGGTLFLDEVGELTPAIQAKLLRVLVDNQLMRVGGHASIPIDVRYIAATNRDLAAEVAAGQFREDLYDRLNGFTLTIPPLRARRPEIVPLAEAFLREDSARRGARPFKLSPGAVAKLEAYPWPGNVRQLRNVVHRAAVVATSTRIYSAHLELVDAPVVLTLDEPFAHATTPARPTPVPSDAPVGPDSARRR